MLPKQDMHMPITRKDNAVNMKDHTAKASKPKSFSKQPEPLFTNLKAAPVVPLNAGPFFTPGNTAKKA